MVKATEVDEELAIGRRRAKVKGRQLAGNGQLLVISWQQPLAGQCFLGLWRGGVHPYLLLFLCHGQLPVCLGITHIVSDLLGPCC
jgi:hypothetical protein